MTWEVEGHRWLLINVFFWPDAVGGATRVVMDQARALVKAGAEVTVLCSARRSRNDYSVEVSPWEGCRVVRLHAPLKPWHHHTDEGCYEFMDRWLEREQFDRVHAHCLQVLTADVLLPAMERNLSVAVSLHDGWWLGRHMFFTGITGRAIRPGDWLDDLDLPESQHQALISSTTERKELENLLEVLWTLRENGIEQFKIKMRRLKLIDEEQRTLQQEGGSAKPKHAETISLNQKRRMLERQASLEERIALEATRSANKKMEAMVSEQHLREIVYDAYCRYRDLRTLLGKVSFRLAVSNSFAELYHHAGVANVDVRENTSLPVVRLPRMRSVDEHGIVFGFVGGWSLHKGIGVLESACRLYDGLPCTLLAVHEVASLNEQITFSWGKVMVKLIPPVPLDDINRLFARFDVLIAPSIWPESYGLVTREAVNAGKWAIASRIGALADPLMDTRGQGFAFTAGSAEELATAMRAVAEREAYG
jgi:glycosyltransferase involved in cell wall biosynthesis